MQLTSYDKDIVVWAKEQAKLLRMGKFSEIDIENIAEEIEDVGKSEQRELASRMAVLIMHLLKWAYQSERRSKSWIHTIKIQRKSILKRIEKTPSLAPMLDESEWIEDIWGDAVIAASKETGIGSDFFPSECPWPLAEVLKEGWLPD